MIMKHIWNKQQLPYDFANLAKINSIENLLQSLYFYYILNNLGRNYFKPLILKLTLVIPTITILASTIGALLKYFNQLN